MQIMQIYKQIGQLKVVPVIAIENMEQAVPLADALIKGGLPLAEITFRTNAAADVIQGGAVALKARSSGEAQRAGVQRSWLGTCSLLG